LTSLHQGSLASLAHLLLGDWLLLLGLLELLLLPHLVLQVHVHLELLLLLLLQHKMLLLRVVALLVMLRLLELLLVHIAILVHPQAIAVAVAAAAVATPATMQLLQRRNLRLLLVRRRGLRALRLGAQARARAQAHPTSHLPAVHAAVRADLSCCGGLLLLLMLHVLLLQDAVAVHVDVVETAAEAIAIAIVVAVPVPPGRNRTIRSTPIKQKIHHPQTHILKLILNVRPTMSRHRATPPAEAAPLGGRTPGRHGGENLSCGLSLRLRLRRSRLKQLLLKPE